MNLGRFLACVIYWHVHVRFSSKLAPLPSMDRTCIKRGTVYSDFFIIGIFESANITLASLGFTCLRQFASVV